MNMPANQWGLGLSPTAVSSIAKTTIPQVWGAALSEMGRGQDSQVAHVTPGEMMIPSEVFDAHPALRTAINTAFASMGANPSEYIVGSKEQKINPLTGQPEFGFFSKIFKAVKKIALPVAATLLTGNPLAGAAVGAGQSAVSGGNLGEIAMGGLSGYGIGAGTQALSTAWGAGLAAAAGPATSGGIVWQSPLEAFGSSLMSSATGALSSPLGSVAKLALMSGALGGPEAAPVKASTPTTTAGIPGSTPTLQLPQIPSSAASVPASGAEAAAPKGAGAIPGSPGIAGALPAGVSFLAPVKNRDTGQIDYTEAPFSNSLSAVRRGTWGGSLLQV